VDPEAEAAGYDLMTSIVRVRLKDGRTLESRCSFSRGQPNNPMTDDELGAKFAECLGIVGIPESSAREAMSRILALEEQRSLAPVLQALTTEGRTR
jgi:2-methylcitrate dehydratase PrpD